MIFDLLTEIILYTNTFIISLFANIPHFNVVGTFSDWLITFWASAYSFLNLPVIRVIWFEAVPVISIWVALVLIRILISWANFVRGSGSFQF